MLVNDDGLISLAQAEPIDGGRVCARCDALMHTRPGDDPTAHCDHCAHELVQELVQELVLALAATAKGKG